MDSNQAHEGRATPGISRRNPADNLTQKDRVRGGRHSAESQLRGPTGRFAGSVSRQKQPDTTPEKPSDSAARSEQ
jgi:hypothetical protein